MRIDSVSLEGFRSYKKASCEFDPGINVIAGKNAQGKTNLLEALYLLSTGRSFRTRHDRELIIHDGDFARVNAELFSGKREQKEEILLRRGLAKQIELNGVKKTALEISGTLSSVLFCPDDLQLISDGAAVRRRLMDVSISQLRPGYGQYLSDFNKCYKNKGKILTGYREKPSLLSTLDEFSHGLCAATAQLIRYRAAFVRRLSDSAKSIHKDFSGGAEELSLCYETVSSVNDPLGTARDIFEEVWQHQLLHRQAELDSGLILTGAHKDDIAIEINGQAARAFASQGQKRTAALSIKLAERDIFLNETDEYPILLLDDVLSELDPKRQEFVLNRIGDGQTLITCCEQEEIASRTGGRVLMIEGGEIRPVQNKS